MTASALLLGAALRAALILFTLATPSLDPSIPTTDVDHAVAFRGAAAVAAARSACAPYADPAFRYPPTVALLAAPAARLHPAASKGVYAACDLAIAALTPGGGGTSGGPAAAAWALNPISASLAARGSADAVPAVLVLLAVKGVKAARRCAGDGWVRAAALAALAGGGALGAAAYHRLVPALHALPLALHLSASGGKHAPPLVLLFLGGAGLVGGSATLASLAACGRPYWTAAVAHHAARADARHSFAPAFLGAHLGTAAGLGGWRALLTDTAWLTAPLQAVAVVAAGLHGWKAQRVAAACALQALAFVTLNRVVTAQYWMWWAALLPSAAVEGGWGQRSTARGALWTAGCAWAVAQAAWLAAAHRLEGTSRGGDFSHATVWAAALLSQAGGVALFWAVARA